MLFKKINKGNDLYGFIFLGFCDKIIELKLNL